MVKEMRARLNFPLAMHTEFRDLETEAGFHVLVPKRTFREVLRSPPVAKQIGADDVIHRR
jgi:hypothetical protein